MKNMIWTRIRKWINQCMGRAASAAVVSEGSATVARPCDNVLSERRSTTKKGTAVVATAGSCGDAAEKEMKNVVTMQQIRQLIMDNWEVRFNVLDNNLEVRDRTAKPEAPFVPMTERLHNSIAMAVQEVYPMCFKSRIDCFLFSSAIAAYHPLSHYLRSLPEWDGTDHVGALAARVSRDEMWTMVFRRWLRGAVKGWLGAKGDVRVYDCQLAPLLVSEQQGMWKSTFCRSLLPPEWSAYFSDKFDLTSDSHAERLMGQFALINMDEFDRFSERQMGVLKNLMQLTDVKMRRPRSRCITEVPRVAAFIGTSNSAELLVDATGSRRFFCLMVEAPIDNAPIDHRQLYAQVMAELANGERTFFTKAEEAMIEAHNRSFYRHSPLAEAFLRSFALPEANEEPVWMTANDIFEKLKHDAPKALMGISIAKLGREMRALRVPKKRTGAGYRYGVRMATGAEDAATVM